MYKMKLCFLVLLRLFMKVKCNDYYNLSCVVGLCERFNIRNIDLVDFSHGINSGLQSLPDYFEEFALRGIRVQELSLTNSRPNVIGKRDLHALNSAFLFFNIDPATQIENILATDEFGTSPSLFIYSLVASRGGFTVAQTLNYALSRANLKFNSRAYVTFQSNPNILYEVEKISGSHPITIKSVESCVSGKEKSLPLKKPGARENPKRGVNLKGVKITAVAAPLTDMEEGYDQWTKAYIQLWENIAENLNFTLQVKPTGRLNLPDASWGGMMDAVSKGTVDFSLAPVIMLPSTFEKVDFSAPVHSVSFSVLMRSTASARIRWTNFLLPFHSTLWFTLLASIVVLTLLLTFFWKAEYERRHHAPARLLDMLSESFICIHGAACMQGHPDPPLSSSSRVIHFSALVSAVIVMATYSGSFTAFLTVRGDDVPFKTLDQLLKSSRFRPYTLINSPEHSFFEDSQHDSLVAFRSKGAPSTAPNLNTALQIACNKNVTLPSPWSKKIAAFVVPTIWVDRFLDLATCPLTEFPMTMQTFWMAFPMKFKLPYKKIFDQKLRRIFEGGSIHRFEVEIKKNARMWREYQAYKSGAAEQNDNILTMTILDFAPLAALLGMGAAASIVVLSFECLFYHLW